MQLNSPSYDVIVVGLGPGGSTAALELSKAGLSVLALDQAKFPRYKPCGGCLSIRIDRILDPDFHKLIEREIFGATIKFSDGKTIHIRSEEPVAYMIMRDRFDQFLLQKVKNAGVWVREGERATAIIENEEVVKVKTPAGTYKGRYLIGADGVNSIVGRSLGFYQKRLKAVLVEGEINIKEIGLHGLDDEAMIEFGSISYGYGWIFPKADHLSIGVGGIGPGAKGTKMAYQKFMDRYDVFDEGPSGKQYGYSLPVSFKKRRLTSKRTILIGDAAGLVDPFLGEGIYYAVRSGQLAAQQIGLACSGRVPDLLMYQKNIDGEIYAEFSAARKITYIAHMFPRLFEIGVDHYPEILKLFFDVLRGKMSYQGLWRETKGELKRDLKHFVLWKRSKNRAVLTSGAGARRLEGSTLGWNAFLAKGAWSHLEVLAEEVIKRGALVLDAGLGTGEVTKMVFKKSNPRGVIGVDQSCEMLRMAMQKLKKPFLSVSQADFSCLPFSDNTFDVVISAWALERQQHPKQAVTEFLRIIKNDGYVICLFSNLPERGVGRFLGSLMTRVISKNEGPLFLEKKDQPYHNCPRSSLAQFAQGLITVVVLRKCCTVNEKIIPHHHDDLNNNANKPGAGKN